MINELNRIPKRLLIITVAGISERFSQSLGKKHLKCIYYYNHFNESLLYHMLHQNIDFDKYIIVGGFMYKELESIIKLYFTDYIDKIILTKNEKYREYGSGYSLYMGLQKALEFDFDEIVFAEGDLFVDTDSFHKVIESDKNVITCNQEPILANKAVAFYYDEHYGIHYIYDTGHYSFQIREPFLGIFNSGQIWKFNQPSRVRNVYNELNYEWKGTNLLFIQKYFQGLSQNDYDIIQFKQWINCNTIADFNRIVEINGEN
ncbi:MAG: licC domain protein [Lachnospiraceae bacterium]|jgi:hypothetical protein|nr:licC domain protein [Lachnospiraceae bacterium]